MAAPPRTQRAASTATHAPSRSGKASRASRPYHHGDLRQDAVKSALRIVDADGVDGLTMSRVAESVGVRRPALNYHFGDLDGLRKGAADDALADLDSAMRNAARAAAGPAEAFRAVGAAYIEWGRAHRQRYELIFRAYPASMPIPDARRALMEDDGGELPPTFALGRPQDAAAAAAGMPDQAFFSWAAVHGITMLLTTGPLADVDPARQDDIIRTVLHGIGAAFGMAPPLGVA